MALWIPRPTPTSFPYMLPVSIRRYPRMMAMKTISSASSLLTFQVPYPIPGIVKPSFKGILSIKLFTMITHTPSTYYLKCNAISSETQKLLMRLQNKTEEKHFPFLPEPIQTVIFPKILKWSRSLRSQRPFPVGC
ncbi:hypothetical protein SDC9_168710 [bioreactor metagenome]|uniref:Uncharacterized protein n=1 Tax=bioreactor metagenome TaxID=1076179 RepID=A0A645G395_9ZZZZ